MREETSQFETVLQGMSTRLERAGGMPLADALLHMHAIRHFLSGCVESGHSGDLLIAMERAGLGEMADALLGIPRR